MLTSEPDQQPACRAARQAADAAKTAGNKVQGEAKGAGGGDGPSLGDAANKAKQAVGNVTSVSSLHRDARRRKGPALRILQRSCEQRGMSPLLGMVDADAQMRRGCGCIAEDQQQLGFCTCRYVVCDIATLDPKADARPV